MFDPEASMARFGSRFPPTTAAPAMPPTMTANTLPFVDARPDLAGPLAAFNRRQGHPPLAGPRNDLYGGYTVAQLASNPALARLLGRNAGSRWAARTPVTSTLPSSGQSMPGAPGPTSSPSSPSPGGPAPSGPFFMPGPDGRPIGAPPVLPALPPGNPSSPTGVNEFLDPMMMFLSAVPAMNMNTTRAISDAMAQAGGTGNRWGTSAQRTAGQIGAESAMQQNAMLSSLLSDYANRSEDRALQATGQSMGLGNMLDQMAQSRVALPFGVGQYEQGRQDDIQRQLFQDFQQNRLGWLGPMLQAAMSQGAGSPGSPGQIINVPNNDASHGTVDWVTLLAGLFG